MVFFLDRIADYEPAPHGGPAFGWHRLVGLAIERGQKSIRM